MQFKDIFQELVVRRFQQAFQLSAEFAPKLLFAVLILAVGWVCAVLIKKIVAKLLRAFGVDVVFEKTGGRRFLEEGGVKKRPSILIG